MTSKKISLLSLSLLIIAAIDSIRNLPSSALFGSALVFFFVLSAILFLFPTALVSAELSAAYPEKGGIYHWVNQAFGEKWAMTAIWLQWINTMIWYPTILSFIAGTAAYFVDPSLAQNKSYLIVSILVLFWTMTLVNLRSLHFSARVNSFCAVIGTVLPMAFLIVLGGIWVFSGQPLQIHISADTLIPSLNSSDNWVSLIAIMASFLGMELSGVHVNEIRNPQRNFPKAVLAASAFILVTMLLGPLTIAYVLPAKEINLIAGTMQVFTSFFDAFGLRPLVPVMALMIVVGTIGGMTNWIIAPAKGLLHAAEFGYLPRFFSHQNRHGSPARLLVAQAVLVSLFMLVFLLVPSVNAFYWFLTALSTELYMCMYILMFCAALRHRRRSAGPSTSFRVPGGKAGLWTTCLLGFCGTTATIVVSFFPPTNIDVGTPTRYLSLIAFGTLVALAPLALFFAYRRRAT